MLQQQKNFFDHQQKNFLTNQQQKFSTPTPTMNNTAALPTFTLGTNTNTTVLSDVDEDYEDYGGWGSQGQPYYDDEVKQEQPHYDDEVKQGGYAADDDDEADDVINLDYYDEVKIPSTPTHPVIVEIQAELQEVQEAIQQDELGETLHSLLQMYAVFLRGCLLAGEENPQDIAALWRARRMELFGAEQQ